MAATATCFNHWFSRTRLLVLTLIAAARFRFPGIAATGVLAWLVWRKPSDKSRMLE
jgi:hypothetical protein